MKMHEKTFQDVSEVTVGGSFDVIVAGGGPAGVGAALAAVRQGKKTLLIEKSVILGGLATLGLVVFYNPPLDDGKGRKLVGGLAEELMHLSVRYSYGSIPPQWKPGVTRADGEGRYQTVFNAPAFSLALNETLTREGVHILYDAHFSKAVMDGGRCRGLIVETKAGRYFYASKAVVDCTGDAAVFASAGAPCTQRSENWLSYWALSTDFAHMRRATDANDIKQAIRIEALGATAQGADNPEGARRYGIASPEEVSEFIIKGQELALARLRKMDESACLITLPGMAQYRKTRAIPGLYTIDDKDRGRHFEDSVGCAKEETQPYWFEIPYRSLITSDYDNLFAAGRIISSDGMIRETTRLIAICVQTGEACGIAASMAAELGCIAGNVPVNRLQQKLNEAGNILHY